MTATAPDGAGGLSPGPLLVAAVLASPALWRALEQHELPLYVALQRLLVIAVLCVVVGDAVRRYLDVVPAAATPTEAPTPIEQTPAWGAADPGNPAGADLFALDPLPGEELEPHAGGGLAG